MNKYLKLKNNIYELSNKCLGDSKDVLECLNCSYDLVKKAHFEGMGGINVCSANSFALDLIITHLYNIFINRRVRIDPRIKDKFCIIALGGYGRGQLSPKSDIDLMFLYRTRVSEVFKTQVIDEIMYPLWNTGLKLGHSSRTKTEVVKFARKDIIAKNSMFDSRLICGSTSLYDSFLSKFLPICYENVSEYINELLRLKRDRHSKFSWSIYLQEPNLKNGIGGLRDFQTLVWMCKLFCGTDNIRELVKRKVMTLSEYTDIINAHDYLLRTRNSMHYYTQRATETLNLELQAEIAQQENDPDIIKNVETFMWRLYSCFRTVDVVSKSTRKRMRIRLPEDVEATIRHLGKKYPRNKKIYDNDFVIYRGEIDAKSANIFKLKPLNIIKVFELCQEYSAVPSDKLEMLIKDNLHLIDDSLRQNSEANETFMSIIQNKGRVAYILELMHFLGVLGAFIPEFGEVTCMVQHEFYHRFTVDVHTLNAIAFLDRIFCATQEDETLWKYHKALISTQSPSLVYLMLFIHDVGKADGVMGHAQASANIAENLLKRLGISQTETLDLLFVVRNHLEMARFWQKNDIEDDSCIERFAEFIGDEDKLRYLYVHTFCDANATEAGFWNAYKQSLHEMLFRSVLLKMNKDQRMVQEVYKKRRLELFDKIKQMHINDEHIISHFRKLPRNYFLFYGENDISLHIKMISEFVKRSEKYDDIWQVPPVVAWHDDPNKSLSRLSVVSRDRSGLFAVLSGLLSLLGLNILGSKIITRSDSITIDTFYVNRLSGGGLAKEQFKEHFLSEIKKNFKNSEDFATSMEDVFYKNAPKAKYRFEPKINITKQGTKYILEVTSLDRPALLYKLSSILQKYGYNIVFARTITEGAYARDIFHISACSNTSLAIPELEETLKKTLTFWRL